MERGSHVYLKVLSWKLLGQNGRNHDEP